MRPFDMGSRIQFSAFVLAVLSVTSASAEVFHATLLDEKHQPLADVKVLTEIVLPKAPPGPAHLRKLSATTNATGQFELDLGTKEPGTEDGFQAMAILANGHQIPFQAKEGEQVTLVDNATDVIATVVDDLGNPVKEGLIRVGACWNPKRTIRNPRMIPIMSAEKPSFKIADDGTVVLPGLPAGWWLYVNVESDRFNLDYELVRLESEGQTHAKLVARRVSSIRGHVTRKGKPAAEVLVTATSLITLNGTNTQVSAQATTDANGIYEIKKATLGNVTVQPSSSYQAGKVQQPAWIGPARGPLLLSAEKPLENVDFDLPEGKPFTGTVHLARSGKSFSGAMVYVQGDEGGASLVLESDAKGEFHVALNPGSYYVAINQVGERRLPRQVNARVTITDSDVPPLDLLIPDEMAYPMLKGLHGIVVDSAGRPVEGASVQTVRGSASAVSDQSGHFVFSTDLEPGTLLYATKGASISLNGLTVLNQTNVKVKLDAVAAAIEGNVTDSDGKPLSGVTLELGCERPEGWGGNAEAKTDAQGHYRFDRLFFDSSVFFLWAKYDGYAPDTHQQIRLKAGETKTLPTLKLRPTDGEIEGTVLNSDGTPAVGMRMRISSMGGGESDAITDSKGHFLIKKVPRGEVILSASRTNVMSNGTACKSGDRNVVIKLREETDTPKTNATVAQNKVGFRAPEFAFDRWLSTKTVTFAQTKGKYVILNFWRIGCLPCVHSLGAFQRLQDKYPHANVVFIGIHAPETDLAKVKAAITKEKVRFPNALDKGPSKTGLTYDAYGLDNPYIIIGDDGKILVSTGNEEDIEEFLKKLP